MKKDIDRLSEKITASMKHAVGLDTIKSDAAERRKLKIRKFKDLLKSEGIIDEHTAKDKVQALLDVYENDILAGKNYKTIKKYRDLVWMFDYMRGEDLYHTWLILRGVLFTVTIKLEGFKEYHDILNEIMNNTEHFEDKIMKNPFEHPQANTKLFWKLYLYTPEFFFSECEDLNLA